MARRTKPFRIRSLRQLEALALPVRTEIVESVSFLGPCSVGELARVLGRKRPVVHFHVDKLVDAKLLVKCGERGVGRRRETLYRTPGSPVFVVYDRDDPRNVELTARYSRNMLSRATKLLERALRSRSICTAGPQRDTYVAQMTTWLSDQELAEVNRLIEELHTRLRPSSETEGKKLCSFALVLAPLFPGASE